MTSRPLPTHQLVRATQIVQACTTIPERSEGAEQVRFAKLCTVSLLPSVFPLSVVVSATSRSGTVLQQTQQNWNSAGSVEQQASHQPSQHFSTAPTEPVRRCFPAIGPPPRKRAADKREALANNAVRTMARFVFQPSGPIGPPPQFRPAPAACLGGRAGCATALRKTALRPNSRQIWPPAVTPNIRAGPLAHSQPCARFSRKLLSHGGMAAKDACVPIVTTVTQTEAHEGM